MELIGRLLVYLLLAINFVISSFAVLRFLLGSCDPAVFALWVIVYGVCLFAVVRFSLAQMFHF